MIRHDAPGLLVDVGRDRQPDRQFGVGRRVGSQFALDVVEQFVLAGVGVVGHAIMCKPVYEVIIDGNRAFIQEVHFGVGVLGHAFM
jgi:hypothetical protein